MSVFRETLKDFDYFKNQKDQTLVHCLQSIKAIGASLEEKNIETEAEIKDYLFKVIKVRIKLILIIKISLFLFFSVKFVGQPMRFECYSWKGS